MLADILPTPLHPAVVHLPIALAVLAPLVALVALFAIRRGASPRPVWGAAVAVFALLLASGWAALQTGEQQEDRVEDVVAERAIHSHEEAAEAFLLTAGLVLVVAAGGLVRGRIGGVARGLATAGTVAILGAGWNVGHSGGELVYRHGAASAYTDRPAQVAGDVSARTAPDARDTRRERDDH